MVQLHGERITYLEILQYSDNILLCLLVTDILWITVCLKKLAVSASTCTCTMVQLHGGNVT